MNLALSDPFVLAQDYPESTVLYLRRGHSTCIRFNRQGDLLASGRGDGTVVIFDVETNGVARKLKAHTKHIQSLSWSSCGRYVLSCSADSRCIIWDLQDGSVVRNLLLEGTLYIGELHPQNHLIFVGAIFEGQHVLMDTTTDVNGNRTNLPSAPKRSIHDTEESEAKDDKVYTTTTLFSSTGRFIISGTNKGWVNVIETATSAVVYSVQATAAAAYSVKASQTSFFIIQMRLSASGRDLVINSSDRCVRTLTLPNLEQENLDPDTIDIQIEYKFADVVNKLSWNHVAFSANGDYVTATTYNNHDIYIWERQHGSLVKILEGPKEEQGVVEWHPHRALIAAIGLETGRIYMWSVVPQQRWSALAPDFVEVEENVEYEEHEDEFDIHPQEEIHKRRLDAEDEDVDVLTIEPLKGNMETQSPFRMPVQLDYVDSENEEEFVKTGRGELRRKDGENHAQNGNGSAKANRSIRKRR